MFNLLNHFYAADMELPRVFVANNYRFAHYSIQMSVSHAAWTVRVRSSEQKHFRAVKLQERNKFRMKSYNEKVEFTSQQKPHIQR